MRLFAYTDGACAGNPGPGGWGAILVARDDDGALLKELEISGYALDTTNNQMEMMAAIAALETLDRSCAITLKSDSKYLIQGITQWIGGWKRRNWLTKAKQPVKNADLWRRLDEQNQRHRISWKWVKGHSGHAMNERADKLAVAQRDRARQILSAENDLIEEIKEMAAE